MTHFDLEGVSEKTGKFIGHMNIKEHFGNEGTSDKGVSDKGVSDKSTGTGFGDVRNANYLRKVYLLHILLDQ